MEQIIQTQRTFFSKPTKSDFSELFKLYSDPEVRKYLGGIVSEPDFRKKFEGILATQEPECYWVVRAIDTMALIGLVSITIYHDKVQYEVSYELTPSFWNQGYGTEIVGRLLKYAFNELNIIKIIAETQKKNSISIKLLEKLGMTFEKELERFGETQVIYGILKND